jgi:hypothetical protein
LAKKGSLEGRDIAKRCKEGRENRAKGASIEGSELGDAREEWQEGSG